MKVLLVCKSKMMENLGVMYISAVVKKAGHECKITDIDNALVMAKIWKPNIVGMSIMTGDMMKFFDLASKIEYGIEGATDFVVGGPDPTFNPENYGWADHVVQGDGETAMAEILAPGSVQLSIYKDIDLIPWPDRTDFPNMKIRDFISSRGCPYACKYCFNDRWAKMFPEHPRVRTREARNVVKEIQHVRPEYVYFQDSCFGTSLKWLKDFAKLYASYLAIPYQCHMRPAQVTDETAMLLSISNCWAVRIALETGVQRLRDLIGRGKTTNEEAIVACKALHRNQIHVMVQNILGLPTSTIENDLETLEVNIDCKPSYAWCSIFVPYPGTELGDMCKENGWYSGDYSEITDSFFNESVLNFDDLHKEQLVCLQRVFALCVETRYLPKAEELTYKNLPNLVHKTMRKLGDNRLYAGLL